MSTATLTDVTPDSRNDFPVPCGIDELFEVPVCRETASYAIHVHDCLVTTSCSKHWEYARGVFRRMGEQAGPQANFSCIKCKRKANTPEELIWATPL